MRERKVCQHCGGQFERPPHLGSRLWNERIYCGRGCYNAAKKARMPTGLRMSEEELLRFEDKIIPEPNSGCWIWTSNQTEDGYGQLMFRNKQRKAHRVSYEHFVGEIPEGLQLDHLCRVRCCVNPHHLEPVTQAENVRRGIGGQRAKERAALRTHCPHDHPLSGSNLWIQRRANGCNRRRCRACTIETNRRSRERRALEVSLGNAH